MARPAASAGEPVPGRRVALQVGKIRRGFGRKAASAPAAAQVLVLGGRRCRAPRGSRRRRGGRSPRAQAGRRPALDLDRAGDALEQADDGAQRRRLAGRCGRWQTISPSHLERDVVAPASCRTAGRGQTDADAGLSMASSGGLDHARIARDFVAFLRELSPVSTVTRPHSFSITMLCSTMSTVRPCNLADHLHHRPDVHGPGHDRLVEEDQPGSRAIVVTSSSTRSAVRELLAVCSAQRVRPTIASSRRPRVEAVQHPSLRQKEWFSRSARRDAERLRTSCARTPPKSGTSARGRCARPSRVALSIECPLKRIVPRPPAGTCSAG